MGWWPFSKKREPADINEAELLEWLKTEVSYILSYINSYINEYYVHKAWNMHEISQAISTKEKAIKVIKSKNTPTEIANPSYRSQNVELINEINGIFSILRMPLKDGDIVAIENAEYMKKKCQGVIDKIKELLRKI